MSAISPASVRRPDLAAAVTPPSGTRVTPELEAKLERRRHRLGGTTLDESLDWYYYKDSDSTSEAPSGPHSLVHLRELERRGELLGASTKLLHKRWLPEWTSLSEVPESLGFRRLREFDVKKLGLTPEDKRRDMHEKAEWFYADVSEAGQPAARHSGPVTLQILREELARGVISLRCLVWRSSMPDWVSIETVLTAMEIPFTRGPSPARPARLEADPRLGTPDTAAGVAKAWAVASGQKSASGSPVKPSSLRKRVLFSPRTSPRKKRVAGTTPPPPREVVGVAVFYVAPLTILTILHVVWAFFQTRWLFFRLPSVLEKEALSVCSSSTSTCWSPAALGPPSEWRPTGLRAGSGWLASSLATPLTKSSRGARVNDARDGFIVTAVAPRFDAGFSVEHEHRVEGGLALDDSGLLYYSPRHRVEDSDKPERISLLALDASTGERRWATLSSSHETGATPMVLNDPDAMDPTQRRVPQWVLHATRSRVTALRSTDGSVAWSTPTGLPPAETESDPSPAPHTAYVAPPYDAVLVVTLDGWIAAFDRRTGRPVAEAKRLPCPPIRADGTEACVTSLPAVAPDGRVFLVASARDDFDGVVDGVASRSSLYLIDWAPGDHDSTLMFRLRVAGSVLIGETPGDHGSPAVSQDGRFVLVGHGRGWISGFSTSRFEDPEHQQALWSLRVPGETPPSLALASDEEFAVYAQTESHVSKLRASYFAEANAQPATWSWPAGEVPSMEWSTELSLRSAQQGQLSDLRVAPSTPLLIAGNGAVVLGVDVTTSSTPFAAFAGLVLKSGVVVLDRATGEVRSASLKSPEALESIALGHDGSILGVHAPEKRAGSIRFFGSGAAGPVGGLASWHAAAYWALARDAMCAAQARAENVLAVASGGWITSAPVGAEVAMLLDARQVGALVRQAVVAHQISLETMETQHSPALTATLNRASDLLGGGVPLLMGLSPKEASNMLAGAKSTLSEACRALSSGA